MDISIFGYIAQDCPQVTNNATFHSHNTYVRVKSNFRSAAVRMSPMVHIACPNSDICKNKADCLSVLK